MGNRAVVAFVSKHQTFMSKQQTLSGKFVRTGGDCSPAIYLHWNGGPESVYAFIEILKTRCHLHCPSYAAARFANVATTFVGRDTGLSVGLLQAPSKLRAERDVHDTSLRFNGDDVLDWVKEDQGNNGVFIFNTSGEIILRIVNKKVMPSRSMLDEADSARQHSTYTGIAEWFAERQIALSEFDKATTI